MLNNGGPNIETWEIPAIMFSQEHPVKYHTPLTWLSLNHWVMITKLGVYGFHRKFFSTWEAIELIVNRVFE